MFLSQLKTYIPKIQLTKQLVKRALSVKIQEVTKEVPPFSNIHVKCKYNVRIKPYDLLDCPDSNKLRATVVTSKESHSTGTIDVDVSNDKVNVFSRDGKDNEDSRNVTCILEVPVKSCLQVKSKNTVEIHEMHSDAVEVEATRNIKTKNLRSRVVSLKSEKGNILCSGLLLAHKIDISTKRGNINLDKVQGDLMYCKADEGKITTQSCYVEASKFEVVRGHMNLKNIHKKSEVYILEKGKLEMSGFHGNAYIKTNGADLDLHFSEVIDDNIILANDSENVSINISDLIEKNCFIEIHSDKIILDDSVSHLSHCLDDDNYFRYGSEQTNNKLLICGGGKLKLGKMSWAEMLKLAIGNKDVK